MAVKWLGLGVFTAVTRVQLLVRELRSCKPPSAAKNKRVKWYILVYMHLTIIFLKGREPSICNYAELLVCSVTSDSVTLRTVAHQTPLSMEFSRQEDCSGLPFPPPGDLPHLGIEPVSLQLLHGRQILYH